MKTNSVGAAVRKEKRAKHSLQRIDYKYGFGFITPMLIGFAVFVIAPLSATVYLSFCD